MLGRDLYELRLDLRLRLFLMSWTTILLTAGVIDQVNVDRD
jgi:hypothetical protein